MANEFILTQKEIENRIFTIRDIQVMVDYHLAELYQVETKRLNEQVKRNNKRFPKHYMFQLTQKEWEDLQSQIATTEKNNNLQSQIATAKRRSLPYVFTEQGVAMLASVLNSDIAIKVSIQIIDTFIELRKLLNTNLGLLQRMDGLERKQIETDHKFEQVFKALEDKNKLPKQGVFFDGQIFDAYKLTSKIIRSAKQSIILIDNYIDESTITHLAKKNKKVKVLLLTKNKTKQVQLDVRKANEQYGDFQVQSFSKSHDRFLIIDDKEIYHLGASLKDLGKKWFAFSKMDPETISELMGKVKKLIGG